MAAEPDDRFGTALEFGRALLQTADDPGLATKLASLLK